MTKKYIIWVSQSTTDPLAVDRAEDLRDVLDGGWTGDFIPNGSISDLQNAITNLAGASDPTFDILIYIHDVGHLGPNGPKITDGVNDEYLSVLIDDIFIPPGGNPPVDYLHITVVMTGKQSCHGMDNFGHLMPTQNFTIGCSMGRNQQIEPDAFNLAFQLPGPATDHTILYNAIKAEVAIVRALPGPLKQDAEYHP